MRNKYTFWEFVFQGVTLVPLTLCCQMLGVDAKTLRLWLASAQLSCCPHPTDARLKCLTPAQIESNPGMLVAAGMAALTASTWDKRLCSH